jgi:putative peptidoglycan lipid II flippase
VHPYCVLARRGLIALGDTRTPLLTNTAQIAGRALLLAMLIAPIGVLAIPIAFAVTASLETLLLGTVLLLKLRRLSAG